jgi:hypothetical protein
VEAAVLRVAVAVALRVVAVAALPAVVAVVLRAAVAGHWRLHLPRAPAPVTEASILEDFSYSLPQKL